MIAGAAILPINMKLPIENTILKITWRLINMMPFMIIFAIIQIKTDQTIKLNSILSKQIVIEIILCSLVLNVMFLSYFYSGEFTIFSHASMFTSLGGVIIVIYKLIFRHPLHKLEIIGTAISVFGCVICLFDR
jgi:drug/metabolite transporter (DMT)-like permease